MLLLYRRQRIWQIGHNNKRSSSLFKSSHRVCIQKADQVDRPTCETQCSLSYLHLSEGQTTKESCVFLSPAQSQHIPQILDFSHKACALAEKRVAVAGVLTRGNTAVGGRPEEERGQCQSTRRRRKGRGAAWWARAGEGAVVVGQTHKRPGVISRSQGEDIWIIALCSPSLVSYRPCGTGCNGSSSRGNAKEKKAWLI